MKNLRLIAIATFAFILPVSTSFAEDDTPMSEEMSAASKALKSLRKIDASDWDALAAAARTAHEALLKSMAYEPALIKAMPEGDEKVSALADSRMLMGLSYAAVCELELAYLSKDAEKVAAVTQKIKDLRKEGHEAYKE